MICLCELTKFPCTLFLVSVFGLSYGLDVNIDRAEDVLVHQRLLALAKDPEKRPACHIRFMEVTVSGTQFCCQSRISFEFQCEIVYLLFIFCGWITIQSIQFSFAIHDQIQDCIYFITHVSPTCEKSLYIFCTYVCYIFGCMTSSLRHNPGQFEFS